MEEQKNKSKEVKMQPTKGSDKQQELTKEQLTEMANQLFNENRALRQQNQQMNQAIMRIERLDYLLKVINIANNCKDYSFDVDFIQKCIDEVQMAMTPPENSETTEGTKEN